MRFRNSIRACMAALACGMLMASCAKTEQKVESAPAINMDGATTIVYNVFLKPHDLRDPYEPELFANFNREAFVDSIFEAVYHHRATITNMKGEPITLDDVKSMEVEDPNYSRDKLAGIQFTEDWKMDPNTLQMHKKVRSMLLGYEVVEDSVIDHFRPGLVINFK